MRVFQRVVCVLCGLLLLALGTGCGSGESGPVVDGTGPEPLRVVATTGMVADLVRAVGGERVELTQLIDAGVDPHLYAPTRTDVSAVLGADAVFYNGFKLEGKMEDTFARAADSGTAVFAVAERVEPGIVLEEAPGVTDPHLWMDPVAWAAALDVVHDALADLDPASSDTFRINRDSYRGQIDQLLSYAQSRVATVPESARVLITAHDAFGYFGERFGFEVVGIQGISTESEAGVRDIERLVAMTVSRNIAAVFVESTVSDRNIEAIISGAEAAGHTVRIGGSLFSDAMGEAGTYEGTYIGMMDHNVTTIVRALGGEAPERGMLDKLSTGASE